MSEMPTAEQVSEGVDLTGKVAIVTGSNVGIGKETARVLALRNAHVILACRSLEKGEEARAEIISSIGDAKASLIEVSELDLSSLSSTQRFAETFKQRKLPLHLLINNAGAYFQAGRKTTQEGFEAHFGTNHLGPFYLTHLLLPLLQASGTPSSPARVVVVSSGGHRFSPPLEELLDSDPRELYKDAYNVDKAYCLSKLCNVLFSFELNKRLAGSSVVSNSLHPGLIVTNLVRDVSREEYEKYAQNLSANHKIPIFTIPQGAATSVFAAVSEEGKTGGRYLESARVSAPRADGHDPAKAERLWILSEKLVAEFEAKGKL